MSSFILLLLGLLLIFIEFFLPGAVMGIAGGIMVLLSIVLFAMESESILWTVWYVVCIVVVLAFLIRFALWRIRTAKPGYSIYSDDNQDGFQASSFDTALVGKMGIVATDLKPGGHILVDGKRVQAISQSGYIPKGNKVIVIGGQEESLIVKSS
jgi:membrane-bound serine protease (ClpP class)